MGGRVHAEAQAAPKSSFTPVRTGLLQHSSASHAEPATVPPIVHEVLRSPGQPLAPETRAFMESRFGHDFSHVRVHTDAQAAEAARAVQARAFTLGSDVVFGALQYPPCTNEEQEVLAHELAHVIQQSRGGPRPIMSTSAAHEQDAATAASGVQLGQRRIHVREATGIGTARQEKKPMTAAHAAGSMGELDAAFALGKRGFWIVVGPGGPAGHNLTESGFDIVAYHPKTRKLWIVDNKAVGGTSKIQEATAITKNLKTNLSKTIDMLKKAHNFPEKSIILKKLNGTLEAVGKGKTLPTEVRLVVTNAGGYATGVGKKLAEQGVRFEKVVEDAIINARKSDIKAAQARGASPGRPASHAGTEAMQKKVKAADLEALKEQEASRPKTGVKKKAQHSAGKTQPRHSPKKAGKVKPLTGGGKPPGRGTVVRMPAPARLSTSHIRDRVRFLGQLNRQVAQSARDARLAQLTSRTFTGALTLVGSVITTKVLQDAQKAADSIEQASIQADKFAAQVSESTAIFKAAILVHEAIRTKDEKGLAALGENYRKFVADLKPKAKQFRQRAKAADLRAQGLDAYAKELQKFVKTGAGSTTMAAGAFDMMVSVEKLEMNLRQAKRNYEKAADTLDEIIYWFSGFSTWAKRAAQSLRLAQLQRMAKQRHLQTGMLGDVLADKAKNALETAKHIQDLGSPEEQRAVLAELWRLVGRIETLMKTVGPDVDVGFSEDAPSLRSLKGQLLRQIGRIQDLQSLGRLQF